MPGRLLEDMTLFFAVCIRCTPVLPLPFDEDESRKRWIEMHGEATGHPVLKTEMYRTMQDDGVVRFEGAARAELLVQSVQRMQETTAALRAGQEECV